MNHVMKKNISNSMLILTIILMDLLTGMEFDLFVPSFPQIQSHFYLTPFLLEALLSINFIGYCLGLFLVGELGDRYSRKPVILTGLAAFVIGSVFCLCGTSYSILLIGRFLQGLGIAAPSILSFLIIADNYPMSKQRFYMAIFNGIMNISVAAAPVLGSYITLYFQWHGNFLALFLIGLVALLMTSIFVPKYQISAEKESCSPIRYKAIFNHKKLMLIIAFFIFNFVPYWIFVGISPLLYIKYLNVNLAYFGFYQGAIALTFAIGSICLGFFIKYFRHKGLLTLANGIFFISLFAILTAALSETHNPLFITLAVIIFVIGQITPSIILYPICLNLIPEAKARVSALMQAGRLIFASLSLEIAGYFFNGSFKNIGIIMACFIFMVTVTLTMVVKKIKVEDDDVKDHR